MNKQNSNTKQILIIAIAFTFLGIINTAMFVAFTSLNIVAVTDDAVFSALLILISFSAVWLPVLFIRIFKVELNPALVIFYEVFMIFALIIGCLWDVYEMSLVYDKVVHFASGILFSVLFFDLLAQNDESSLSPVWLFLIALSFAMLIGSVWEICEFGFDTFFDANTQSWMGFTGRDVLKDTMIDVICDFVGGVLGSAMVVVFGKRTQSSRRRIGAKKRGYSEFPLIKEREYQNFFENEPTICKE